MFIAACVKKGVQPCKGGMFICVVAKTLLKITKLTRMVRLGNRTYRVWDSSPNYPIYFLIFITIGVNLRKITVATPRPSRHCFAVYAPKFGFPHAANFASQ